MMDRFRARFKTEFGFLRGNFLVLMVSYMLSGLASGLFSPFRPKYIEALGASVLEIGYISSVGFAISAVINIPGAYIADRYGRKRVIVVFTYFVAIGYLVHALAPNWWYILLGSIILSLSRVYMPALQAIEADSLPRENRGMGYSLINMMPSIFSAISPPIAGLIIARYEIIPGMRWIYIATTLLILAIAVIRTFYLQETLETDPLPELTGIWSHFKDSVYSFREAINDMNRDLWAFMLIELLYSFEVPVYSVYVSLYALDILGITEVQWGLVNSVFLPVSVVLGLPVGKLVDRMPRRHSSFLGYSISMVVGVILFYASGINGVLLAFLLRAVGQTIQFPAIHALRADLIPIDKRGRVIGLISVLKNIVAIFAATFFAFIYESISPRALFVASVFLEVMSLLIIIGSFKQKNLE